MKVALVHELLTMKGGAERVLRVLAEMFSEAPIYTLLYDEQKLGEWFPADRIRTPNNRVFEYSITPDFIRYNHHLYLNRFPAAVESWPFNSGQGNSQEFDLVISSSSAFTHGIITNGKPKHLCYVHSPARYLWDRTHDVVDRASKGPLGPLKRWYLERTFHRLRMWDAEVAPRPDKLLAASREVQRRIELYWRRESDVVYPPIDDFWLADNASGNVTREHPQYFLIACTLAPYKRIDLAIEACNEARLHLKIVGEGPDRERLEEIAGPTIEFYGYREGDELRDLYSDAQATIVPGDEDFGLMPVESMACGTPVISLRSGGPLETILEGETGMFFDEPLVPSLQTALESFDSSRFSADACRHRAAEFRRSYFEEAIRNAIDTM